MNLRKTEYVLTLIAGLTGIIAGNIVLLCKGILVVFGNEDIEGLVADDSMVVVLAIITLIIGILLIIFAAFIKRNRNTKLFGVLTLIAAAVGFFLVGLVWIVPGELAIIVGIMCLVRKVETF
ncbi:hypothetical protein [Listeria innocua]|uniref:hypothetical protein n=1 Tax=Listeria innocua TaxID=1642 RepID=UPI0016269373|nr:hypothetical protein [Listeria innocua]MBC2238718.1 hypothetical protein [Listeria innocua]